MFQRFVKEGYRFSTGWYFTYSYSKAIWVLLACADLSLCPSPAGYDYPAGRPEQPQSGYG